MPRKYKRMRLPNGFGQITELKGRRLRKPFRAMITVGHTEEGKPICKLLKPVSYFETYNDAYKALVKYNENPYDFGSDITMDELYEKWLKDEGHDGRKEGSLTNLTTAWSYCHDLYEVRVREVKAYDIKNCIDNASIVINNRIRPASSTRKKFILIVIRLLFDYAVKYELVDRNPARQYKLSKAIQEEASSVENIHIAFTDEEMKILWGHSEEKAVKIVLIQCYSGWRPNELLSLRTENVNINEMYFVGGMKTKAGTNRTVPIHSNIQAFVKEFYDESSEYLFTHNNRALSYDTYSKWFKSIIERFSLNLNHRPHDPRKWFISEAKRKNINEYALKRLVGHSISDITEKVYTERPLGWLRDEIEKL